MTEHRGAPRRPASRRPAARALVVALAVGLGLAAVAATVPGAAVGGGRAASPAVATDWSYRPGSGFGTFTNGIIDVNFPGLGPTATVTLVGDARVSTTVVLAGLAEVSPDGYFASFASFAAPSGTWHLGTASVGPGTLEVSLTAVLPVLSAEGDWEAGDDGGNSTTTLGNASVQVDVYLNNSPAAGTRSARVAVGEMNWPWIDSTDALGLDLRMVAASDTRIAPAPVSGQNLLEELANTTGAPVANLSWAPTAAVLFPGGPGSANVTTFHRTATDGANSTVRLLFGSVPGNYSELSYDPWISLNPGSFSFGVPPAWALDLVAWVALGVGVALVVGLATLAARRRPRAPDEL